MKIKIFCPLWGQEHLPFEEFCQKVKAAGYDGVEMPFHNYPSQADQQGVVETLQQYGLGLIAQHWETAEIDFEAHKKTYAEHLKKLLALNPIMINTHTGKDYYSFDRNSALIEMANEMGAEKGIRILHETHRGRFSFSAQQTMQYLQALPDLRITTDFSHWCCVSESLLEGQEEALRLAIDRADYIHCRVGHGEGPQITDPRSEEWRWELEAHLGWWDRIIARHRKEGQQVLYMTPEFGPHPYMTSSPFGGAPLADQWEVNYFMQDLLRKRYAEAAMTDSEKIENYS
ncbi:sugar phosphate isomerase/epimerase [Persicobacter psychrovividus]|uniref:Xylose isomerase-like TIM barrel domain-containing protein n=1 Tax=Persicobacter psychrovividus TaxID=387638 RepID=A0ABM7VDW3_9BACT|nr:hypothetical protein PEPS_14320 [Persicobacter psychrovividus]